MAVGQYEPHMTKFPSASARLPDSPDSTKFSPLLRAEREGGSGRFCWALLGDNFCRLPVLAKVSPLLDPVTCAIRPGPKGILMSEPDLFRSAARLPTWPTPSRPGQPPAYPGSCLPPKAFAFDRASEPKPSLNAVGCHWACARSPSCSSCIVHVSARESQRRRMPLKPFDKQQESSEQSGAFQTQPVRANKAAKAAGGEKAGQPPPYWQ
uniref:Uncharacterized protein n=1 Tax=Anopheles coluzzii TaxID=1518534 RepID=A0A8W7P0Q4_ANOCL